MPAAHGIDRGHPQGAPGKCHGPCGKRPRLGRALAEGLEGGESLHGVEELGAELAVGPGTLDARAVVQAVERHRQNEGKDRTGDQDRGHGQIEEGHETEDSDGRQDRDQEGGQELAEVGFELLDPVDHGKHHIAGALLTEPGGPEHHGLVVDLLADGDLDTGRGLVGDHDPQILQAAPRQHHAGDDDHGHHQVGEGASLEDHGDEPAKHGETGNPRGGCGKTDHDGKRDAAPNAFGERPEAAIEVHGPNLPCRGASFHRPPATLQGPQRSIARYQARAKPRNQGSPV